MRARGLGPLVPASAVLGSSVGVISGLDRSIDSLTGFSISGAIQTDDAGIREGDDPERFQARSYRVEGDIITRVQGTPVGDPEALSETLLDHRPGDVVTLTVHRDGSERSVRVRLRERPRETGG